MKELFEAVPHVDLGVRPTPVEKHVVDGLPLRVKRDDLIGGNKIRCLEYLLVGRPKRLLTFSTLSANHALATALAGRRLGIETDAVLVRWGQAGAARAALTDAARRVAEVGGIPGAIVRGLWWWRPGTRIIPPGGMTPHGALGYTRAVFELDEIPARIYVPHGTGTTTSGLLAGLMLRRANCEVVAVNVTGQVGGEWRRAFRAARLLGQRVERGDVRLRLVPASGEYGEQTDATRRALEAADFPLDGTYGAPAMAVLLRERPEDALFVATYAAPSGAC